jgi:hypothetical protein
MQNGDCFGGVTMGSALGGPTVLVAGISAATLLTNSALPPKAYEWLHPGSMESRFDLRLGVDIAYTIPCKYLICCSIRIRKLLTDNLFKVNFYSSTLRK